MMDKKNFDYEKEVLKFWEENKIYEKVKERNRGAKQFNFVEGPPYPTGDAHLGHLRNWAIKDSVLRFRRLLGDDVYSRDGYDVHGLPVENKVQAKLGLKTVAELKSFGEDKFVSECKNYALEKVGEMSKVRERFGFWLDRNYYYTSHPDFVSLAWRFFKIADEKGLLYKDYKTVAWCAHDETTLSDYEIKDTYTTLEDPSVYVKFPLQKMFQTTGYDESLLIWTTTPWTLQSNLAIAVNPNYDYAKVLVEIGGREEVLIVAEPLVEKVISVLKKSVDIKLISVLEVVKGAELEGVKYAHIYLDETPSQQDFLKLGHKNLHGVVLADYVTLGEGEDVLEKLEKRGYKHKIEGADEKAEDVKSEEEKGKKSEGTGLVHIAPGHGFEDYEVGRRYNLPIFCPVGPDGKFTEGKYSGMYFKDVDPVAIDYLRERGFLLHSEKKSHRYPCCWRCKTPIVYRAAEQWWIRRSEIIDEVIRENSNVKWFPDYAKRVFENLMSGAGDWPISRQRYWGTPLPIFEDEDGNYEVFGSREELENRVGKKLDDVHRDNLRDLKIVNSKSGKEMRPVPFITDVWFDSGCVSFASHYGEGLSFDEIMKRYYPIKWITESEDQIRGWFSSLFSVGYIVSGRAPYNEILYYGFVKDKEGRKMSKSLGNGIMGSEAIDRWGADGTRYYLLTKSAPEEQINFDPDEFLIVDGFFNILENAIKFANDYLSEYEMRDYAIEVSGLDVEDKWILYKLNVAVRKFNRFFENYEINLGLKEVENFFVNDFSRTYLKIVKERQEGRDENLLSVFCEVLRKVLIMFSVAIPFRAESFYQGLHLPLRRESVFLEDMPICDEVLVRSVEKEGIEENFSLAQDVIAAVLNSREKVKIGVRWPMSEVSILSSQNLKDKLKLFEKLIEKLTNVRKISYESEGVEIHYNVKPNFATLKVDFENVKDAIRVINLNKKKIESDLVSEGILFGEFEGLKIDYGRHLIREVEVKGEFVSSNFSEGMIILHTHQDEILLEEGYLRELLRRVQDFRKDLGLSKKDKVKISFDGSDDYFKEIVTNWGGLISRKVGADEILAERVGEVREFDIKGKKLVVGLVRV